MFFSLQGHGHRGGVNSSCAKLRFDIDPDILEELSRQEASRTDYDDVIGHNPQVSPMVQSDFFPLDPDKVALEQFL